MQVNYKNEQGGKYIIFMEDVKALKQERYELFDDVYHLRTPKRVPITIKVNNDFGIQYADMDLVDVQWHPEKLQEAAEKICEDFFSDKLPFGSRRFPAFYVFSDSEYFAMSKNGMLQHPEVSPMNDDEYDEFIANPFDFSVEKILPRLYPSLADPEKRMFVFIKATQANEEDSAKAGAVSKAMSEKYGYFNPVAKSAIMSPYDFIADVYRGFKGISFDIRRNPQKVIDACEAVIPLQVKMGVTKNPIAMSECYIPLHMAGYMKTKDFEKFYWPPFKKMIEQIAATGQGISFFNEHDWSRYLDHLSELPEGIRMRFEYGDPKQFKEKLGKKFILSGFYPIAKLSQGTVEENLDLVKEYLDILAPNGNYTFDADKVMTTYDGGRENYIAVLNYIRDNGKY